MKKTTKSLSLVLMGSLTMALGGCGSDKPSEEFRAYNSIEECVKDDVFSPQECKEMAIAAVEQSPKFNSLAECEAEYGQGACKAREEVASGERRSSWMPLLAGYMAGRYLSGGSMMRGSQPLYPPQQQAGTQPGATTARTYRTLGGGSLQADAGGKVTSPTSSIKNGFAKTAKPYVARTKTSSRSGFSGAKASS